MEPQISWIAFKDKHPRLGMSIDVRYYHEGRWVENNGLGTIKVLRDMGDWIGIDTNYHPAMAAKLDYEWRETQNPLPQQ